MTMTLRFVCAITATALLTATGATGRAGGWRIVGWNNLGMHCMDADFSVFSVLPPYNTIHAQLVNASGQLLTNAAGITVTYQAVADPAGSINTTSQGKSDFWQFAQSLFGLAQPLAADRGLTGLAMPGAANQPQPMSFDTAHNWFIAEGIPITPIDDARSRNPYPMMRLVAKDGSGNVLASTDIVLPVSDEMDCRACHSSGSGPAARPAAGWVNDPDAQRDYRLNILRLHDERHGSSPTYQSALSAAGYNTAGLYAQVTVDGKPILCATCHASNALGTTGRTGVPPLTSSVHFLHAGVTDPTSGLTLNSTANRSACYRCHPGSTTRCLRGAMGSAVAADGSMAIQCQSCHGSMSAVGAASREGWLDEPNCQSCHTGTAIHNNGQIRYTSAFDAGGQARVAVDQTFGTNANVPSAGFSLFRFSSGHGGLLCEACHGSTHAEYPSTHVNDNVQSTQLQGHVGMLVECSTCHASVPSTVSGGPHGMHPVGQSWASGHGDAAEQSSSACQACHGSDYRGSVLSRVQANRTITAFGSKNFWRGFQIGCFTCHNGPSSENANSNRAPVVSNASASTPAGVPVAIPLSATDADHNPLTLRIVSQPQHGTAGLGGMQATYSPAVGFVGTDFFTFAAWDGATDSNLGTVTVTVTAATCTLSLEAAVPSSAAAGDPVTFQVTPTASGCTGVPTFDWDFGDGTAHANEQNPSHTYAAAGTYTWRVAATLDPATASAQGTITIGAPIYRYLLFIAHNPGRNNTLWRSDVAVLNLSSSDATLDLTFFSASGAITKHETLAVNDTAEWRDAVASLFGVSGDAQGAVAVLSNAPLIITVRSYTPFGDGTVGQTYPAVSLTDTIERGQEGVLPHLRGDANFRTNVGFINVSGTDATISVHLFDSNGVGTGSTVVNVPAWRWTQVNDVFAAAGVPGISLAYAQVQVHTSGSRVWAYASVVDNATGDPATVLMVAP